MKKIFTILSIFLGISVVHAETITSKPIDYYVTFNNSSEVFKVNKYYDESTLDVLFNISYDNHDISNELIKSDEYSALTYGVRHTKLHRFNTLLHYGYYQNKSDYWYYLTQVAIWKYITGVNVLMVNDAGVKIDDYDEDFNNLISLYNNQYVSYPFNNVSYTTNLWSTLNITYNKFNIKFDNPNIAGLTFNNVGDDLLITAEKPGMYDIEFTKNYHAKNYGYYNSTGTIRFWYGDGGARDLSAKITLNVLSTNLIIEEHLNCQHDFCGDAFLDSKYELYLDDEFKMNLAINSNNAVRMNSTYLIKDVSNNLGIKNSDDLEVSVEDNDYKLVINKSVILKDITINIKDNYTYQLYLKSTNKLVETLNKDNTVISLPVGTYYIVNENINYYEEFIVTNEDIIINIDNALSSEEFDKEDNVDNVDKEDNVDKIEDKDDSTSDIINDIKKEDINDEKNDTVNYNNKEVIEDTDNNGVPKTGVNTNIYLYMIFSSISIILLLLLKLKYLKN